MKSVVGVAAQAEQVEQEQDRFLIGAISPLRCKIQLISPRLREFEGKNTVSADSGFRSIRWLRCGLAITDMKARRPIRLAQILLNHSLLIYVQLLDAFVIVIHIVHQRLKA